MMKISSSNFGLTDEAFYERTKKREQLQMSLGWEENFVSLIGREDPEDFDSRLATASLIDVTLMLSGSIKDREDQIGSLIARLVELGDEDSSGNADHQQLYTDAMRLQRQRLEQDALWRRRFALHPRTYGRPATQLITDADDWVVPMIEAEVDRMPPDDLSLLRHRMIMRVGRQHDIHRDFRPLLLKIAIDDETLTCLASTEQGLPAGSIPDQVYAAPPINRYNRLSPDRQTTLSFAPQGPQPYRMVGRESGRFDMSQKCSRQPGDKSYLIAAVAQPFTDVVMLDPDDGIELEAAAWDYAQRQMARAYQSTSANHVIESLRKISSLLTMINSSRSLAATSSQAHVHAGLATKSAIAEFILLNFVLLMTNAGEVLENNDLKIGCFIRRDDIGRSPIDLPQEALELWANKRSCKRLLQDLAMITLLRRGKQGDLPTLPVVADHELSDQAHQHFVRIEQGPLGRQVVQAIHQGWHFDCWAGAA